MAAAGPPGVPGVPAAPSSTRIPWPPRRAGFPGPDCTPAAAADRSPHGPSHRRLRPPRRHDRPPRRLPHRPRSPRPPERPQRPRTPEFRRRNSRCRRSDRSPNAHRTVVRSGRTTSRPHSPRLPHPGSRHRAEARPAGGAAAVHNRCPRGSPDLSRNSWCAQTPSNRRCHVDAAQIRRPRRPAAPPPNATLPLRFPRVYRSTADSDTRSVPAGIRVSFAFSVFRLCSLPACASRVDPGPRERR
ncbi:Uncharacterised protein [Mycobacteroides abscessus subsp. abscessus]|nr:Uncharacterised protein [Mycobacteroides abscessus subsp. abscessus]